MPVIQSIVQTFIMTWMAWFCLVKRKGCCCWCILCLHGPIWVLIFGILLLLSGVVAVANSLTLLGMIGAAPLYVLPYLGGGVVFGVSQIILAIHCIKYWQIIKDDKPTVAMTPQATV